MAKSRYINTKFWSDGYISDLDPVEKLLFLYFLTNERTTICGVYELPIKHMSTETGIEKEMILKVMSRFEKDGKVIYRDGWVRVVNFEKHQDRDNEKIKIGIKNALELIPAQIKQKLYDMDSLSIAYGRDSNNSNTNSNTNSNSNSNSNSNITSELSSQIKQVLEIFAEYNPTLNWGNKTTRKAASDLIKKFGLEDTLTMSRQVIAVQGKAYAPVATTPYQMKEKLAQFRAYFDAEKNKSQKAKPSFTKIS